AAAHAEWWRIVWSEAEVVVASVHSVWGTLGCTIPAVGLPAEVATAERVATSEKALTRSGATLSRHALMSRPAPPSQQGLVVVALTVAMGVPLGPSGGNATGYLPAFSDRRALISVLSGGVPISKAVPCVPAFADSPSRGFRKGCRACLWPLGLSWLRANSAVSVTVCHASSLSPGARHLRACPRDRLLPLPGTPSSVHLLREFSGRWACSSGSALVQCGPASPSHCLALCWFRSHIGRSGMGPQFGRTAVVVVSWSTGLTPTLHGGVSLAVSSSMGLVGLASWAVLSGFRSAGSLRVPVPEVHGGSVCGPSSLWRSEVVVPVRSGMLGACVVRLWSHVVAPVFRSECELQESVAVVAGCACFERGCWFARAVVGFVLGLRIRVGVLPEFFSVGSGGDEASVVWLIVVALHSRLRCIAWLPCVLVKFLELLVVVLNGALVVLVEVLPEPVCVASTDREVGFISRALWALPDGGLVSAMGVWLVVLL
ncbi:hypothetical protein Taro_000581, partial [Colocasia esculenta]|nr:hypothetical protein [Colocasia esculenta]